MRPPQQARFARQAVLAPVEDTKTPARRLEEARMREAAARVAEFRKEQEDKPFLRILGQNRRVRDPSMARLARRVYIDELDDCWRRWMRQRDKRPAFKYTRQERNLLRSWFNTIDADGSGEIDADELADPLLSTGVARTYDEVEALMEVVDSDGSGEIGFEEFLAVLKPGDNMSNPMKKLREELDRAQAGVLPMTTLVTVQRRKYLLDAIMGSPDDLAQLKALQDQEHAARKAGDLQTLGKTRQQRLIKDEAKKEKHRWLQALEQCVERNRAIKEAEEAEEQERLDEEAGITKGAAVTRTRRRSSLLIQPSASELTETQAIAEIEAELHRNGWEDLDTLREERQAVLEKRKGDLERARLEVAAAEEVRRLQLEYVAPVPARLLPSISSPSLRST